MYEAFTTLVYTPLYNGLIFFIDIAPWHDVGIAVILLTVLVRVILIPFAKQASETQRISREIAPDIEKLKEKYKDNKEEQARALFALYREKKLRPFSTLLLVFLQLPILFGLYYVFWKGGLPAVDEALLYSFVSVPENVRMEFLSGIDLGEKSLLLAALAGLTQFAHTHLTMGSAPSAKEASFANDMARSMHLQMKYVLPVIIAFVSSVVASAVPLYFITSNLFLVCQELIMRRSRALSPARKDVS